MQEDATSLIRFSGGALERAAWDRLWDTVDGEIARRALGARRDRYRRRVEAEEAALARLGLEPGVLLELSWLVRDLRMRGVTFGPGYGPQSGSLLLHLLGLNGVDPVDHSLPFLGFGRELEARRLHLRVASRIEQAETVAALRHFGSGCHSADDARVVEVVVAADPVLAFTRELERMARAVNGGRQCDPLSWVYPWDDPETLRSMSRGETEGVHQLSDPAVREMLRQAMPRTLDEVVQVLAACREGASPGFAKRYLEARAGTDRPPLPHPWLEEVLGPTAHLWLYREQPVAALRQLLGCSWERALELLQRLGLEGGEAGEGALSRQLGEAVANHVGLPRARGLFLIRALRQAASTTVDRASMLAEATESYRQAFYKAHYPAVFQAARMNTVLAAIDPRKGLRYTADVASGVAASCPYREEVVRLCSEALRDGLTVLPPDINRSEWGFTAVDAETIVFGLGAVANIDRNLADRIALKRRGDPYRSFMDFCLRIFRNQMNERVIEPLIFAGALDGLDRDRRRLRCALAEARVTPGVYRRYVADDVSANSRRMETASPDGEGYDFQRELDVIGCVPSRVYYPSAAPPGRHLRLVP